MTVARRPSFAASADDVAVLLGELNLEPVDVFGFSNGGQVALQLAIRHPSAVRRLIAASAPFRRDGMVDGFWAGLEPSGFDDLPAIFRDADFAARGDESHAPRMFDLDRELMLGFTDWPDADLESITAPTLVIVGDRDVVTVDHALRLSQLIPDARLLVIPSAHGAYLGEVAASTGDADVTDETLHLLCGFWIWAEGSER